MSDRCSGTLDRCASTRTSPDPLSARGLHTAPSIGSTGSAEQESPLRSPVPHQCRNSSGSGTRSETSRRRDWLLQRVTHVESEAQYSSACPLCRSCRRPCTRAGLPEWPAPLRGRSETPRSTQDLCRLAAATVPTGLGGLLETSLRGPRICAAISGPLHSSCGHLEPSPGLPHRWPSHFSLA